MGNPCKKCKMSQNEKAACCGCHERLEWENYTKEQKVVKIDRDELLHRLKPDERFQNREPDMSWLEIYEKEVEIIMSMDEVT